MNSNIELTRKRWEGNLSVGDFSQRKKRKDRCQRQRKRKGSRLRAAKIFGGKEADNDADNRQEQHVKNVAVLSLCKVLAF